MRIPDDFHKEHEEHENLERWLVSYADFITLLFAFFVVMYASSTNNPNKVKAIEDAIRSEMNLTGVGGSPTFNFQTSATKNLAKNPTKQTQRKELDEMAGAVGDPSLEAIKQEMQRNKEMQENAEFKKYKKNLEWLQQSLKEEVDERKVVIHSSDAQKEIVLFLDTKSLFDNGSAKIKGDFDKSLVKIARALDEVKGQILISGHTGMDRIPSSSSYQNNLELSAARATKIGSYFVQTAHTLEDRIGVESYGANRPINKSGSLYQSLSNSRIEINVRQK